MSHDDHPGLIEPVLRQISPSEVLFKPVPLDTSLLEIPDWIVVVPVVELRVETDDMKRSKVEAVEVVVALTTCLIDHCEAIVVLREVPVDR